MEKALNRKEVREKRTWKHATLALLTEVDEGKRFSLSLFHDEAGTQSVSAEKQGAGERK